MRREGSNKPNTSRRAEREVCPALTVLRQCPSFLNIGDTVKSGGNEGGKGAGKRIY
jgi:hypothetical protein